MQAQHFHSRTLPRVNRHRSSRGSAPRAAFTLVELLVVIAVVTILAGLITAAAFNATRTARVASVKSEISNLEKAITDFKLRYGVDVPSFIRLHEDGSNWSNTDTETRRSRAIIQRIWPRFSFGADVDINGDGDDTDVINLNGTECLVFFLGGVCNTYTSLGADAGTELVTGTVSNTGTPEGWIPLGFSANPVNPFDRAGTTRVQPFIEFDNIRFIRTSSGMPGYRDPIPNQQTPYAYGSAVSSARGAGYQAGDFATGTTSSLTTGYTKPSGEPHKPRSFQIISPGYDFTFGTGGVYDGQSIIDPTRANERDNISNFSNGEFGG
ncbi:MAG: type II secretion system protein [Planctomycetaceae bacterium]